MSGRTPPDRAEARARRRRQAQQSLAKIQDPSATLAFIGACRFSGAAWSQAERAWLDGIDDAQQVELLRLCDMCPVRRLCADWAGALAGQGCSRNSVINDDEGSSKRLCIS